MKRTAFKAVFCLLLAACIALSGMLLMHARERKREEALYMNHMFSVLSEALDAAEAMLRGDVPQEVQQESFLVLRHALRNAAEELENGQRFVADCVPGAAAWWFEQKAAEISNVPAGCPGETGELSAAGRAFLEQLQADLRELMQPLLAADGMNLNPALGIEEFSEAVYAFYSSHS